MKELTEKIKACVRATSATLYDNDQRSAIGMAGSWVRSGKPIERSKADATLMKNRDDLAVALGAILEGHKPEDCKKALAAAREMINAPFVNAAMLGFQARRMERGAVGSEKKNDKAGL